MASLINNVNKKEINRRRIDREEELKIIFESISRFSDHLKNIQIFIPKRNKFEYFELINSTDFEKVNEVELIFEVSEKKDSELKKDFGLLRSILREVSQKQALKIILRIKNHFLPEKILEKNLLLVKKGIKEKILKEIFIHIEIMSE